MNGVRWTRERVHTLRMMTIECRSNEDIATAVGTSPEAVIRKRIRLGLAQESDDGRACIGITTGELLMGLRARGYHVHIVRPT